MSLKNKTKDELIQLIYKYRAAEALKNAPVQFEPEPTFLGRVKGFLIESFKDILTNFKKRFL